MYESWGYKVMGKSYDSFELPGKSANLADG